MIVCLFMFISILHFWCTVRRISSPKVISIICWIHLLCEIFSALFVTLMTQKLKRFASCVQMCVWSDWGSFVRLNTACWPRPRPVDSETIRIRPRSGCLSLSLCLGQNLPCNIKTHFQNTIMHVFLLYRVLCDRWVVNFVLTVWKSADRPIGSTRKLENDLDVCMPPLSFRLNMGIVGVIYFSQ